MLLRTAALFGRDPTALRTTAEMLALRGIHPTVDAAEASLKVVRATPLPDKPAERRPLNVDRKHPDGARRRRIPRRLRAGRSA